MSPPRHSDEGITAFAEAAAREECESDACYVRLDRMDEDGRACVRPAVYDHETLSASREMNMGNSGMNATIPVNNAIPEGCKVLLACEGGWDVVFIRAMISRMKLPAMHAYDIEGKSEFRASAVSVISMDPRFRELRAFGAILDADHDGDDPPRRPWRKSTK